MAAFTRIFTILAFLTIALHVAYATFLPSIPFVSNSQHHMHPPMHMVHFSPTFHRNFPPLTPLQGRGVLDQHPNIIFGVSGMGKSMHKKRGPTTGESKGEKVVPVLKKSSMVPGNVSPVKITVAERVLQDMDLKMDPCVDFYQYSCGGYQKKRPLPNGYSIKASDPMATVTDVLIAALGQPLLPTDATPFIKAKTLYQACMNEDMIAYRGTIELHHLIKQLGGWPVLGKWNPMFYNLEDALARSRPYMGPDNTALIGVTIERDVGHFGRFTLFVDQPRLGQPNIVSPFVTPDMYLLPRDSVYTMAYQQYIADIATDLGAPRILAEQEAKDIVDFEIQLAKIMLPVSEHMRADLRYKKISIYELYLKYSQFDWLRYLRGIATPAGVFISQKDSLVLWDNVYYDKLFKLLKHVPARTIANYITWRTIQPLLATQGRQIQLQRLRYDALSNGAQNATLEPRDRYCAQIVNAQMAWVTGRIFIDRHPTGKQNINMVRDIGAYMKYVLTKAVKEADWLSKETKISAMQKIKSTAYEIGFPGYVMDNTFLHMYYKQFQMKPFSFFWSMKNCLVQNYIRSVRQLLTPDHGRWRHSPTTVRSRYSYDRNAIEMPMAMLDEPFFSIEYSPAMNFGGLGSELGRLQSQAIDLKGLLLNAGGLLQKTWSKQSVAMFNKKAQCLLEQFSMPVKPEIISKLTSAEKTLNENLADLIGIKAGYYAYKLWTSRRKVVDKVPGLSFTGDQLYFINFARRMCDKISPEVAGKWEHMDVFPLSRRRLMSQLQNIPEFSKTFQCPPGSPMNPPLKCKMF